MLDVRPLVTGTLVPMGSSFTSFNGFGFWARDPSLEVWLFLLADEISRMPQPLPDWLCEARQHWLTQSRVGFIGCISAALDDLLADEQRVAMMVDISISALIRLKARGPLLDRDYLNSLNVGGPGSTFTRDAESRYFTSVGAAFIDLLLGNLTTDAVTSPVL